MRPCRCLQIQQVHTQCFRCVPLQLPISMLLSLSRCAKLCAFPDSFADPRIGHETSAVCFFLEVKAHIRAGRQHVWAPYVAALPGNDTAFCWSEEEVKPQVCAQDSHSV